MRLADGLRAGLAQAEALGLARVDQLLDGVPARNPTQRRPPGESVAITDSAPYDYDRNSMDVAHQATPSVL
jgi:hypothetical protein